MNLPDAIRTARWMVRDTARQSLHTKLFWVMLAVTAVTTVFCLSVDVTGDVKPTVLDYEVPAILPADQLYTIGLNHLKLDKAVPDPLPAEGTPAAATLREKAIARGKEEAKKDGVRLISGEMTLGFGAFKAPVGRDREDSVRMLELWLVAVAADTVGVLLALLWTAGFLPTFLEPQSATVLLAKPAPRWAILFGKYIGVVLFVGLQATVFVGCTWLALGVKTGVWYGGYWLAVPLLVVNFGIFYAVSAFLAVWTRSTVASAFGTLLFWILCWVVNYTHMRMAVQPLEGMTPLSQFFLDAAYWFLPKPLDMGGIFYDAMRAEGFVSKVEELRAVQEAGKFHPELSVLASSVFTVVTLGLAAYEFEMTEY
ncbi:ABC transporter permease [Fimbriiglobus ruber]|uniref:ABC transporter permease n=1 Tax=Fimbriiglobus ruber TaxID=1908690 RepID=A0A225DIM4_9BACT|nr:ABC transporter permease subunit [Fimbriiglobus ruber]OWK40823.1 hypothetical protein FRUB_04715 [Fimbriiglobus ruber]